MIADSPHIEFDPVGFGQRLYQFRQDLGYTQEKLAALLDTTQANIALIESGQRRPGAQILTRLFVSFRSRYSYLLTGSHTTGLTQNSVFDLSDEGSLSRLLDERNQYASQMENMVQLIEDVQTELQQTLQSITDKIQSSLLAHK